MPHRYLITVCVLLTMISATVGPHAQDNDQISTQPQYTILFTQSDQLSSGDIYALHPESGERVVLITEAFARYPVWSSINQELAFISGLPTGDDILIINVESLEITNLTQNRAYEIYPRWSPDGERIAFATDVTGDWEVFVINRDGSGLANLSNNPNANDGGGLDWSTDGKQIVFMSDRNGRNGIYVMDADGSNQRLLVSNDPPSEDRNPVWSPSTNQIAFVSHRADGYGIYLVNEDGSELTYLRPRLDFPPTGRYGLLSWSPNGVYLAYEMITEGVNSTELYLIEPPNGSDEIRLTDNDLYDAYPSWVSSTILELDIFPMSLSELLEEVDSQ